MRQNIELANYQKRLEEAKKTILDVQHLSGKTAIVMALENFKAYEEMAYLMSSSKNAKRLNHAIKQLEQGKGKPRKLLEE